MSAQPVLFDALGPKARRRIRYTNLIVIVLALAVLALVLWRLGEQGQLSAERWLSAINGTAWVNYLLIGLQFTLQAAAISVVSAVVFGLVFGFLRLVPIAPVRWVAGIIVEFFRAVPVLVLMVFAYQLLSRVVAESIGMDARDTPYWAVIIGLTLYNGAVIAELVRSGVRGIPRGQREAAYAVGMSEAKSLRLVEIPQALVAMLPSLLGQFVIVLKDSALGYIIGFSELLSYARQLGAGYGNIMQALFVAAVIFILLNFALTWIAQKLAGRLSSRTAVEVGAR